jgi:hypothetical protein
VSPLYHFLVRAHRGFDFAARAAWRFAPKKYPMVFLNTIPKSGSVYLAQTISKSLGLRLFYPIAGGHFPDMQIIPHMLRWASFGNAMVQEHLAPSDSNIALLRHTTDRVIVHFRDPRQATLSWYHHLEWLNRQKNPNDEFALVSAAMPTEYWEKSEEDKIAWLSQHWLPDLISWIQAWSKVDMNILYTTHEQLAHDSQGVLDKITEFYGLPRVAALPTEEGSMHFRKGKTDEFKDVPPLNVPLPDELNQFGWG